MLDIGIIFKLAGMGICTMVIDQVLRSNKKENMAIAVDIIATIIGLGVIINYTADLINTVKTMFMF